MTTRSPSPPPTSARSPPSSSTPPSSRPPSSSRCSRWGTSPVGRRRRGARAQERDWRRRARRRRGAAAGVGGDCAVGGGVRGARVEKMIDDEKNVGLELHLHLGEPTVAEEARLLVLSQVASKDAFNVLRTQKQLGYVVQCGTRSIAARARAQRARAVGSGVAARARGRGGGLARVVPRRRPGRPQRRRSRAIRVGGRHQPRGASEDALPGEWARVDRGGRGTHRWQYKAELAAAVRSLTKAELLDFFDAHFAFGAPLRRKVSSHCYSPAFPRGEERARAVQRVSIIDSVNFTTDDSTHIRDAAQAS